MASTPAMAARRFSPPDRWNGTRSSWPVMPDPVQRLGARGGAPRRRGRPRFSGPKATSSRPSLLKSWSSVFWKTMPTRAGQLLALGRVGRVEAGDRDRAAAGDRQHAAQAQEQRRLARAVGADRPTDSPGATAERQAVQGERPSRVGETQVADVDHPHIVPGDQPARRPRDHQHEQEHVGRGRCGTCQAPKPAVEPRQRIAWATRSARSDPRTISVPVTCPTVR